MGKKLFSKYVIRRQLRSIQDYVKVFLAIQSGLDRQVELRLLARPVSHGHEDFSRFQSEFKALAQLDHPHIIRVFDVGYTKTRIYYTTEYRQSISLEQLLTKIGAPLTRHEITEVALAIGSALQHIHSQDLLHRNLTTETVFYDLDNQRPYIADFSLLKQLEAVSLPAGTSVKRFVSIPTPELFAGIPFDQLTDLYLFGALLYRLATNRHPFPAPEKLAQLQPETVFEVKRPTIHNTRLSARWEGLILKLLAPKREERFQSAKEFLQELESQKLAMDAESLINRQRSEILQNIREKIEDEEGSNDKEQTETEEREPLSERVAANAKELVGIVPGGFKTIGAAIGAFIITLILISILLQPGPVQPRRTGRANLELRMSRQEAEDALLKITATLKYSGIPERVFLQKWAVLRAYTLALPETERSKVLTYGSVLAIKLKFYRDPGGATDDLKAALKKCDTYIKQKK